MIQLPEHSRICGLVRGYELSAELCPDSDREFARWWPKLKPHAKLVFERKNLVTNAGLQSVASAIGQGAPVYPASTVEAWRSGKLYQQAVGTANNPLVSGAGQAYSSVGAGPQSGDVLLFQEACRRPFNSFIVQPGSGGPMLVASAYFSPTDYWNVTTQVASPPAGQQNTTSALYLNQVVGLRPGDVLRVAMTTGWEYQAIASIAGNQVALAGNISTGSKVYLSSVPAVGTAVDQMTVEAGMFGDEGINPAPSGIATFTNGSTAVSGAAVSWGANQAGTYIRADQHYDSTASPPTAPAAGLWYPISGTPTQSGANGSLTIASAYSATDLHPTTVQDPYNSGNNFPNYALSGTMFNHLNNISYVKLAIRGFIVENDWTLKGV